MSALPSTKNPLNETSFVKTKPIVNNVKIENFPLAIANAIETVMLFQITKELQYRFALLRGQFMCRGVVTSLNRRKNSVVMINLWHTYLSPKNNGN